MLTPLLELLVGCDPDQQLHAAEPEQVVEPATVDFGEVVLGTYIEIGAVVRNEGLGTLRIDGAELESGGSSDLSLVSWPEELAAGDEGLLVVRYTPDIEGEDWGTVQLTTNQTDTPMVPVTLTGLGVKPCIDIDPELLWFGLVEPGASVTKSFDVRAGCTGTLRISHAELGAPADTVFTVALPEDWAEPYTVRTGFSFSVDVTFAPTTVDPWEAELVFTSNDPDDPTAAVQLRGNTVDDPTENVPPYVELTEPDVGEYFLDNQLVTLTGLVNDEDEPATNLICGWYANGSRLTADATVAFDGTLAAAVALPVGDVEIELRCFDSEGEKGGDSTTVKVWAHEDPLEYLITGGSTLYDYLTVDDDLTVHVNGVLVFQDDNNTKDTLAPIRFEARAGDTVHLTAVDQNSCDARLDPLVLHWGSGESQALNAGVCLSACPDHDCFDGSYAGPWPGVILDEEYVIAIP